MNTPNDPLHADILDSWFPPAPSIFNALQDDGAGLIQAIVSARGIPSENLVIGPGSSSLMHLALRKWLTPQSRVLIPDPTYDEYTHVLEDVIGCRLDRMVLSREQNYDVDLGHLRSLLRQAEDDNAPYDLVVLVNPNNPTGRFTDRAEMEALLSKVGTRFWIDEAYIDYVGPGGSLELFALKSPNVVVCKSLSKCYALSGIRVAYLCGPAMLMQDLIPQEGVSLQAQVAAAQALKASDYYNRCWAETADLLAAMTHELRQSFPTLEVSSGSANCILCYLPTNGPDAATIRTRCLKHNVFLCDAGSISELFGTHTLRITVRDAASNRRVLEALKSVLS